MTGRRQSYLTDSCQLNIQCQCKSRCSAKSHSSSCLSSQYENHYFEGGGGVGPLWYTKDEEFPRLISTPPSSAKDPEVPEIITKKKKKKKRKKKVFDIEGVVTGATRGTKSGSRKSHHCKRGGVCKRQRLHSEDSSNKRSSGLGREEQSSRARLAVAIVALSLIMLSFLLVGLTLRMAPVIDELVRKGNEEIYRSMAAGASTSSPTTEESAAVVANNSAPPSGSPG